MIGIDTNILVRYLVQDDDTQAAQATLLIEKTISVDMPAYITLISLVEVVWVLNSCYGINKNDLCVMIRMVLETKQFLIEQSESCYRALKLFEQGHGDFSDALIATLSKDAGCSQTLTFDKKALSVGMELLAIKQ
jgi:predicted nucleic-acid-binding protein